MSKFIHCHCSDGLMWCQFPNGKWCPPFIAIDSKEVQAETATSLSEIAVSESSTT